MDRERDGLALSAPRRARVLIWAVRIQIVLALAFAALLFVGERTRIAFFALYAPRHPLLVVAVVFALIALAARRWLLAALQIGMCALVLFPLMGLCLGGPAASSRPDSTPIRLSTYNVAFGKAGRADLDDELDAIAARVDVLLLQEAYGSLGERLQRRFPERTVHQEDELLLMTRFPLVEVDLPPNLPDGSRPMFVTYVLEAPGGPLRVTNVHPFSPRHALFGEEDAARDVRLREAQVAAIVASARSAGMPFVIAGDTNLPHLSMIARRHFDGLRDAFPEVGVGFGYTFPAKRPWMRIDRVLLGPQLRPLEASVAPRGTSDHRALFAVFEREKTPDGARAAE